MKALGYICISVSSLFLLYAAASSWFFRDGLGPDSVTSSGSVAISRFWHDFHGALYFGIPVLVVGIWCVRRKRIISH
jgi:hypothetical protein